jgi:putative PIN family toxin of toxin-antitoxin system
MMWTIVLDTNVIISARLNPLGAPGRIVNEWVLPRLVHTVTCEYVMQEYLRVAHRAKFARFKFPPPWLDLLIARSTHFPNTPSWPHPLPDRKDEPFIALAAAASAWLITGNLKHFPEAAREGVTVVSPAEYLAKITGED